MASVSVYDVSRWRSCQHSFRIIILIIVLRLQNHATYNVYNVQLKSSWKQEHAGDITLHLTYVVFLVQTITRVHFTGQHSDFAVKTCLIT